MPEEINRGLGSLTSSAPAAKQPQQQSQVQSAPQGYEQTVAVPNSSLTMLNEKRVADNVVQERNTGITLGKIKDEAKAEIMQDMEKSQFDNQQREGELSYAAQHGYKTGLYDAAAIQHNSENNNSNNSNNQNYSKPIARSNGLGRL